MIYLLNKNNMKKLAYIVITSSMFLTTSCVDLTQEPQSFITEEEYIARMDGDDISLPTRLEKEQGFTTIYGMVTTDSTAACNASMYAQMTLHIVQQKPTMNWLITTD